MARYWAFRLLSLLLSGAAIAGCSTLGNDPARQASAIRNALQSEEGGGAKTQTPAKEESASLSPELLRLLAQPSVTSTLAPRHDDEQRFDVAVANTSVREFLLGLAQGTGQNIVVHPDVQGVIDLTLKQTTVGEILTALQKLYGYGIEKQGNVYYVFAPRLETRTYPLSYLNVRRAGRSALSISSGRMPTVGSGRTTTGDISTAAEGSTTGGVSGSFTSPSGTRLEAETENDYWQELAHSLCLMIGLTPSPIVNGGNRTGVTLSYGCTEPMRSNAAGAETPRFGVPATSQGGEPAAAQWVPSGVPEMGRGVVLSPVAGLLVVRAYPNELAMIERYLKRSQTSVQQQVILEAKVVEVELNDEFQSGINWAKIASWNKGQDGALFGQTGGGQIFSPLGRSEIQGAQGNLNPWNFSRIDTTQASAFGGVFTATLALRDFSLFLELLKTQGNVQVLSSPRVATLNNQKAVIKVGRDEYFVTRISSTTTTTTGATTAYPEVELTPFFSGIALDVTPRIDGDEIVMHVRPMVTEVSERQVSVTAFGSSQVIPTAQARVRETDTVVRAKNGQLVVIGGLMQDRGENRRAQVPLLGDMPIVGELFKHRYNVSQKSELVILIRPIVVDDAEVWQRDLEATEERIGAIPVQEQPDRLRW